MNRNTDSSREVTQYIACGVPKNFFVLRKNKYFLFIKETMSFIDCDVDIVQHIASNYLTFAEIVRLRRVNRDLLDILDETFFQGIANNIYGIEFWERASLRPIQSSKPTKSTFTELLRIEQFQRMFESRGEPRWTNDLFFRVWDATDKKFLKSNKYGTP